MLATSLSVDVATIVAGVLAALTLSRASSELFWRTLGRRWDWYRRLRRLGTGVQLQYFEEVLQLRPALRRTVDLLDEDDPEPREEDDLVGESVFITEYFYLQVITDRIQTVLAYSVTTRRRRFRPVFYAPRRPPWWSRLARRQHFDVRVVLGKTRFGDVQRRRELWPMIESSVGARVWSYSETWYFGNPGLYQRYVLGTTSTAGFKAGPIEILAQNPHTVWTDEDSNTPPGWIAQFRSDGRITTYGVIGPHLDPSSLPGPGPFIDAVRTIP